MPLKNNTRFCGARARQKNYESCMQPSMKNGRCRLHGGMSTGAKTKIGKLKAAQANLKHGAYTKEAVQQRLEMRELLKEFRLEKELTENL